MRACLDTPSVDQTCDPNGCLLEGWAVGSSEQLQLSSVELWINGRCVATTHHWFSRDDVTAALALPRHVRPGFAIGLFPASIKRGLTQTRIELRFFEGTRQVGALERRIGFAAISNSSPPAPRVLQRHPTHDSLVRLIARTMPGPHERLVEFNCGRGDVGYSLSKARIHWHGIEGRPDACEFLTARGLPFTRPRGFATSYKDRAFAFALGFDTPPQELPAWLPELRRLTTQGIMLVGRISGGPAREELERIVSRYFLRFESLPYRGDAADRAEPVPPVCDRWFLFAQGWSCAEPCPAPRE